MNSQQVIIPRGRYNLQQSQIDIDCGEINVCQMIVDGCQTIYYTNMQLFRAGETKTMQDLLFRIILTPIILEVKSHAQLVLLGKFNKPFCFNDCNMVETNSEPTNITVNQHSFLGVTSAPISRHCLKQGKVSLGIFPSDENKETVIEVKLGNQTIKPDPEKGRVYLDYDLEAGMNTINLRVSQKCDIYALFIECDTDLDLVED